MAIDDWGSEELTNTHTDISEWWLENNRPINLYTMGRINFSPTQTETYVHTLNKILPREELLKIIRKHDRIKDFYDVGVVQKTAIESFVDDIIIYLSKH